jgi:NAD(P)-dependent dehydrogenase (short-subunit alcohol dehydrogenase family)
MPALREARGRVVNISSGAATRTLAGWGAYCTAKAALKMATEMLADEEPDVTAVSVRPGVVDTSMQATVRSKGRSVMTEAGHDQFLSLHEEGKLLDPAVPGSAVAALALHAPPSMSGAFVSWDDAAVLALNA